MEDDDITLSVMNDKQASIILSSFLENKNIKYFNAFIKYISKKRYADISLSIKDVNSLLYKVNGKTVLEYLLDYEDFIDEDSKIFLANNIFILKECINLNRPSLIDYLSEETLKKKDKNGVMLFDYLLEKGLLTKLLIDSISSIENCAQKLKNKDENLLSYLNSTMLFSTEVDGVRTIDYLFQKNLITKEIIKKIYFKYEIYDLCLKYNREDLLPYLQSGILCAKKGDKIILELLLEKDIHPVNDKNINFLDKRMIKVLVKYKVFDYYIDLYENSLLEKYDGDKTILDFLLENGITPKTTFLTKKESLDIIMKYKRYDLIHLFDLRHLLLLYNDKETYLDIILKEKKAGCDIHLSSIQLIVESISNIAKFYIAVAKNGLINYIDEISKERLIDDNGKLLRELLKIDKDLTLNVIIPKRLKEDLSVAILLKMNGIEQKNVKLDLYSTKIVDEYYERFNDNFGNLPLNVNERNLINEFRNLMLSDGLSDPQLIEAVVDSYTYLISSKNEYGLREIKKLIEIKKMKSDFHFMYNKDGSYYRREKNSINLENIGINALNHEIGHALFHNLTDEQIPLGYEQVIYEIRTDPRVLMKVKEYSIKIQEIRGKVAEIVDKKYMKDYHVSDEKIKSIEEFLNAKIEEQKIKLVRKGYDEETVSIILSNMYSMDEYLEHDKRIKKEELIDAIMRCEYGAFISIGDIIDSIYIGKFKSGELLDSNNNVIIPAYGHGIAYYEQGIDWSFSENIANYSTIIKSPDSREVIAYLKEIVGEKFINLIDNYYRNEITFSNKDLSEGGMKL